MDKSKVVNYQGRDFAIGLVWKEFSGSKPSILKNKIKESVHRGKFDGYGAKIDIDKSKVQVGFSSKAAKDIPSLALAFAKQEEYRGSLVLAKIDENQYWAVSITEDGLIVSGYDIIYTKEIFVETISEFLEFEDESVSVFIASDSSNEIQNILASSFSNLDSVNTFDIDDLISVLNKSMNIVQVYNPAIDTIKQLSTLALTVAAMVGGYFFVFKEDPKYEEITTNVISDNFRSKYSKLKKDEKRNKKQQIDESSYVNIAKSELISKRNTAYENEDIIFFFNKLFNDFPLYLVEWELNDIHYRGENNEYFSITYKRIENSFGFRDQLESELVKLLKSSGYERYSFNYPSKSGDVVEIRIAFKDKKSIANTSDTINNDELSKRTKEIKDELENILKVISKVEDRGLELGFFDKRYGGALEEIESDIISQVRKGDKLFKELKKQKSDFDTQDISFDEALIGGSRSEMLSTMQQYSYYSWKEAQNPVKYPTNQGRGSKDSVPSFYAQSYEFGVDVGSNIDVIGLSGLRTLLLSDKLLNKPYIKIKSISFSLNNEVWSVKGETYEKL